MPTITVRDALGVEIFSADPQLTSGLGKYLKGPAAQLLAGVDLAAQFRTALLLVAPGERGIGLTWSGVVPLGADKVALSIDAGVQAVVGVYNRTGMELLDTTFIGAALQVKAGQAFVSFATRPSLEVGLKPKIGALSFGLSAGTEIELRCYRPFDVTGEPITLAEGCRELLEHFVIPNDAADLRAMRELPAGTLACVSGRGQLQVGASVNLAAAFNPLASVDGLARLGALEVEAGVSATVGVKATVSGDFQIRVEKIDGPLVRLSYHKVAGRSLDVTVAAGAGVGAALGDKDLLALLFGGPGGMPGAAVEDLVQAGISSAQLARITTAMKAGLSRKLELALTAEFSSLRQDEAAFLYELDLDRLDDVGAAAVDRALSGDLTGLNGLETDAAGHGIRPLASRSESLRTRGISWRINLVGIVNVLSMTELVRTGTIVHDEESGELVIADKVTRDRVGALTQSGQIRRLLYESAVMSVVYKASGLDVNTGLTAGQTFFFLDKSANRQRVSDYLDAVAAVGLMDAGEIDHQLGGNDDFGKASLLLESTFGQAASERMFQLQPDTPAEAIYEAIGQRALLALVKATDPDAYRRIPLRDQALWTRMKEAGQPSFRFVLPPPITGGDPNREALRVAVVAADYSVIRWWAEAMATAARRLAEMRAFLDGRTATALDTDPEFRKRRRDLEQALVKVIRRNTSTFDDPWGLVALFLASGGAAAASATVVSPKLVLFLPE